MPQPVRLAPRALDLGAVRLGLRLLRAAFAPQALDLARLRFEAAKGIEQAPVRRRIDQRALIMLPVNLDQRSANGLHGLHAHRLVIDEGAGPAVRKLHAAQNQFVLGWNAVLIDQRANRMVFREIERRRHLALLGAMPNQRNVAARTERKRKRIKQDRLAGAGLAGQRSKAFGEVYIKPLDQNDVADGEAGQHGRRT